jgi:hypothetical protein
MADLSKFNGSSIPQYFNYTYDAPDAIIILNRGSKFEQDITNDVISATTSHSTDSIAGSFNITIDNTNDRYVDRFGYCFIKKMSSVEIFVKSLQPKTSTASEKAPAVDGSVAIPAGTKNLREVIDTYFPTANETEKVKIQSDMIALNTGINSAQGGYKIDKVSVAQQFSSTLKPFGGGSSISDFGVTFAFYDTSKGNKGLVVIPSKIVSDGLSECRFIPDNADDPGIKTVIDYITPISVTSKISLKKEDFDNPDTTTPEGAARWESILKQPIKIPVLDSFYQRIFLGVILNVSQNISPGSSLSINLSGKTNGYWMEASKVNIFPGGFETVANNVELSATANRYAQSHALDIFKDLIRYSTDDLLTVSDFNLGVIGTTQSQLALSSYLSKPVLNEYGDPCTDENGNVIYNTFPSPVKQLTNLDVQEANLYNAVVFDGQPAPSDRWKKLGADHASLQSKLKTVQTQEESIRDNYATIIANSTAEDRVVAEKRRDIALQPVLSQKEQLQRDISSVREKIEELPDFKASKEAVSTNKIEAQNTIAKLTKAGREEILKRTGIMDHWKQIFSQNILEVLDQENFLNMVYPFKWDIRAPEASMDGDYVAKADLARMVAESLMYEFYMDTNGHFVLKPPLYNIGIPLNDTNYIVEDIDLVSLNINDSAEGIITRIGVTGDYAEAANVTLEKAQIYNIHQDLTLIRDYGFHAHEISNRMFLHSFADCRDFGKAYMTKNNMELLSASLTIVGRPELRLGCSIYIKPRDIVFYIKEISHEISAGGEFKTTLTLVGGRRIVTGFPATLGVNRFVVDQKTNQVVGAETSKVATHYYVLTSSLNQQALEDIVLRDPETGEPIRDTSTGEFIRADASTTIQASRTAFGFTDDTSQATTSNDPSNVPRILRNVYQITSHVNPELIGLIVDLNSNTISEINKANYDLINGVNETNFPLSAKDLNINKEDLGYALGFIRSSFKLFCENYGITSKDLFTIGKKEAFIIKFLADSKATIETQNPTGIFGFLSDQAVKTTAIKKQIGAACLAFNQLIASLDTNYDYRQYTDNDGRELPAYLDYGKTLIIESNRLAVNQFNIIQASTDEQNLKKAQEKAIKAKGNVADKSNLTKTQVQTTFAKQIAAAQKQAQETPNTSQYIPGDFGL